MVKGDLRWVQGGIGRATALSLAVVRSSRNRCMGICRWVLVQWKNVTRIAKRFRKEEQLYNASCLDYMHSPVRPPDSPDYPKKNYRTDPESKKRKGMKKCRSIYNWIELALRYKLGEAIGS